MVIEVHTDTQMVGECNIKREESFLPPMANPLMSEGVHQVSALELPFKFRFGRLLLCGLENFPDRLNTRMFLNGLH